MVKRLPLLVVILGDKRVGLTQISAGYATTCALSFAGQAYCWGYNGYGQLGNGGTSDSWVPVAVNTAGVLAGKTLVQIGSSLSILDNAANRASTCALDSVGKVYCWGHNGYGQLGNASNNNSFLPVAVSDAGVLANKVLTQLSVGDLHVCALDTQGQAYC